MRLLVGDSHVRSYIDSPEFNHAVFLGPGKEVNFVSTGSMLSYLVRLYVLERTLCCHLSKTSIGLVVGEPDVRFACYETWWIDDKQIAVDEETIYTRIKKSVGRVDRVLEILQRRALLPCDIVIGVGTPNAKLVPYALQFNSLLRSVCERRQISFFDPQACVKRNGNLATYTTVSIMNPVLPDNTHLSRRISRDLSFDAEALGLATHTTQPPTNLPNSHSSIQYFESFESHRMRYGFLVKIVLKVLSKF
jgi:hypothetical protein